MTTKRQPQRCPDCGAKLPRYQFSDIPEADDWTVWEFLADSHEAGCLWIRTRAHQIHAQPA